MDAVYSSDEPTLRDALHRAKLVKEIGDAIADCPAPMVFGIHGDWGAGKTSFLQQIHLYLTGDCPEARMRETLSAKDVKEWKPWIRKDNVAVVWFEAWRYQHEPNPIVALLHEIRSQLQWRTRVKGKLKKEFEVLIKGALFGIENITKYIGVTPSKVQETGEKWEREHYATQLPTHVIRELLDQALKQLIGKHVKARLVILVDDLDRCESEAAYRLLEGIKIYLNIPSCVFVLGMDQKLIELAVMKHTQSEGDEEKRVLAREYVEKICRIIWQIPAIVKPGEFLSGFLKDEADTEMPGAQEICAVVDTFRCLPANPRKIKAFAHTVRRFMAHVGYPNEEYGKGPFKLPPPTLSNGQAGMKCDRDAGLLVVMACLYQFHYEVYRIVESDPKFYANVVDRAYGKDVGHRSLTAELPETLQESPRERTAEAFAPTFPDPMRGDVFRIQALVRALGPIPEDDIRRCMLGRQEGV